MVLWALAVLQGNIYEHPMTAGSTDAGCCVPNTSKGAKGGNSCKNKSKKAHGAK